MQTIEDYIVEVDKALSKGNKTKFYNLTIELARKFDNDELLRHKEVEKIVRFFEQAFETEKKSILSDTIFWVEYSESNYYQIYSYKNKIPEIEEYASSLELLAYAASYFDDYEYVRKILHLLKEWKYSVQYEEIYDILIPPKPVSKIEIDEYFSLKDIKIENLEDKKEIYFLGENGVGKTIMLQSILRALKGHTQIYFRNWKSGWNATLQGYKEYSTIPYENVFAYGVSRLLTSEEEYTDNTGFMSLFDEGRNAKLTNPVDWLKEVNRLEKNNVGTLKLEQLLKLVNDILSSSDGNESTKDIKVEFQPKTAQIVFKEQNTPVEFKHLADGYRSVLILLIDLLRRLSERQPEITELKEFKGIVLVDEIDMLLHPKWEYSIMKKLREKFPNIQWFLTTHSPMLILGASKDAVFYRLYKEKGKTKISNPYKKTDFIDYMLNGIVTSPLFDLDTARMFKDKENNQIYTGDFLYEEINNKVKQRLMNKPEQIEEIRRIIDDVLNEFEKEGKL